ncbi:helix-turn-helix transcriptional regulator [Hymenobacter setariae]|uniref:Helix-turn-helix transcriptional regulator n=1 Tax=Hymenobacter setariae TaxID=2594794 RepID=A0A558BJR0_9BACT|nr:helix-turn-helix transcriptional regulator [Hymenobacter setariae]TVT36738.1 helix-turn-helix transcriptional regulator [Hymenobacter setariae]
MSLHTTIRQLRKQQNITQEHMAEQLCMARSTYSKLESGITEMPVATLVRIAGLLQVAVHDLMQEDGQPYVKKLEDKFSLMLYQTENVLSFERLSAVPYDELTLPQLMLLTEKGLASQEAYENTPLGGRFYAFGPQQVFGHMMQNFGMSILFEEKLVQDPYWQAKWKLYKAAQQGKKPELADSLDEYDYFTVYLFDLTMPDGSSRGVQMAERDFPEELDEEEVLQRMIVHLGAVSGDILAYNVEGYDPISEIITSI